MLLRLIGPGTLIAPTPVAPNSPPSPAALFHAAPAQFRLAVSHTMLAAPLSQLASAAHFSLLPALQHTPRIAIDGLIISRERWHFSREELAFAQASGTERFVGARRWAERNQLPRFVFVRTPTERKPCFVDLESPAFVDMLAWLVKEAATLDVSEMLPGIDQTWRFSE